MKEKLVFRKQDYVPRPPKDKPLYNLQSVAGIPESPVYEVYSNGQKQRTYHNEFFDFVAIVVEDEQELEIKVHIDEDFHKIKVRPESAHISCTCREHWLTMRLTSRQRAIVELDDDLVCPLYILPAVRVKRPQHVTYDFKKGQAYDIGCLELHTGDVVYIEEGAVVSGRIYSRMASHIQILGNGILYGGNWHQWDENSGEQLFVPVLGEDIRVEGIHFLDGGSWHCVPVACKHVVLEHVNIMGKVITGDGLDIVGCEDVVVRDCFIRANDDCISIKAEEFQDPSGCCNVKDVLVENCIFWNAEFGNTLEIGYETRCDEISNVVFRDCDVVHCQYEGNQSGGVLTIHNADRAFVHDIYYENIRIEDAQEKLIDIKTLDSKYSRDRTRGMVSHIYFKDIQVPEGQFPVSILRGYEMKQEVCRPHDIYFENITVFGKKIKNASELHMVMELVNDVHFL